ncbi:UDP-N-acetylmuramate dehydrogenase [Alcaligenaceae bacterium CGII-47]|nr:UDP-N-acetylmuramate dehydrogenase [Alcaligenaceae bacterium CGII-47]
MLTVFLPRGLSVLEISEQDLQTSNTLGLPARARVLHIRERSALAELSALVHTGERVFVLGGGSNVVMAARPQCVVAKVELRGVRLFAQEPDAWIVEAQAGEPWHAFVAYCLAQGWPGLENLALIPGTVGAAPVQNIGAYGLELAQCVHSVLAWDLHAARQVALSPAECSFAYRDSLFKRSAAGRWLILAVRFRLPRVWRAQLAYPDLQRHPLLQGSEVSARQVFDAVCDIRRRKLPDPAVLGNAGSFFKNPLVPVLVAQALQARYPGLVGYAQAEGQVKLAAGWLIDHAGWRGRRIGPVGMHAQQALVLVNYGGASAEDVGHLARAVREDISARFGLVLEQEPVILD